MRAPFNLPLLSVGYRSVVPPGTVWLFQRAILALSGHPTVRLLLGHPAGFHEGTVAILRDSSQRDGPEAVIGVPEAMSPSPAISTSTWPVNRE